MRITQQPALAPSLAFTMQQTHRVCLEEGLGHPLLGSVLTIPELQSNGMGRRALVARPLKQLCWQGLAVPELQRAWQGWCMETTAGGAPAHGQLAFCHHTTATIHRAQAGCPAAMLLQPAQMDSSQQHPPSPRTSAGCPAATRRWQSRRGRQTQPRTPAVFEQGHPVMAPAATAVGPQTPGAGVAR